VSLRRSASAVQTGARWAAAEPAQNATHRLRWGESVLQTSSLEHRGCHRSPLQRLAREGSNEKGASERPGPDMPTPTSLAGPIHACNPCRRRRGAARRPPEPEVPSDRLRCLAAQLTVQLWQPNFHHLPRFQAVGLDACRARY
jgi:hypothetical protein